MRYTLLGLLAALVVVLLTVRAVRRDDEAARAVRTTISLADALTGGDTAGFRRVTEPRAFSFPADHGPHPGFRTEWWYVTGNLEATNGRRFGYQVTFFRNELSGPAAAEPPIGRPQEGREGDTLGGRGPSLTVEDAAATSAWQADAVFMAHFALTDVTGETFHAYDRFAREALGLAGASLEPFRVWTEDWSIEPWAAADDSSRTAVLPLRLRAEHAGIAVHLRLERGKPPVLQGEAGLSRKGAERGNASYYYSLTRMPTRGEIRIGGQTFDVLGASWMDREWSTSVLPDNVAGWDWFALQLDDGSDLMFYRLRLHDGGTSPFSAGSLVSPSAAVSVPAVIRLGPPDVQIDVLATWPSPIDGARYPARWRVRVPGREIELDVVPVLPNQELNLAVRYWEGAVEVRGTRAGQPIGGRGYVELTGYADDAGPTGL